MDGMKMEKINIQVADVMQMTEDAIRLFNAKKPYSFFTKESIESNFPLFSAIKGKTITLSLLNQNGFTVEQVEQFFDKNHMSRQDFQEYEDRLFKRKH